MNKMYRRIYNKKYICPNGTLIDNWYEEEELRKRTGEGRTIPQKNFPKKIMDFEHPIQNPNVGDDTFKRIMNQTHDGNFSTTYSIYGDFKHPENKYTYQGVGDKNFENYVEQQIQNKKNKQIENFKKPLLLYDTTTNNTIIDKNINRPLSAMNPIGNRLMYTQDGFRVTNERKEKIDFLNKELKERMLQNYVNNGSCPYYKDNAMSYWAMNKNRTNVYRSNNDGFGRSSGFTQPLEKTKGAFQYYGNIKGYVDTNVINYNKTDEDFEKKYKAYQEEKIKSNLSKNKEGDVNNDRYGLMTDKFKNDNKFIYKNQLHNIANKIIINLNKLKGWVSLRFLKIHLKTAAHGKLIEKTEFKYNLYRFGLTNILDDEFDLIFKCYDEIRNNTINIDDYFNSLHNSNDFRKSLIYSFYTQIKENGIYNIKNYNDENDNSEYINFKDLIKNVKINIHPEVIKYYKNKDEVYKDYLKSWDDLKEDNRVTEDNFLEYFEDISLMIFDDIDFKQCLISLGLKI